jgi:hypothetical protein
MAEDRLQDGPCGCGTHLALYRNRHQGQLVGLHIPGVGGERDDSFSKYLF